MASEPCLRCGDFIERPRVPGIALCEECTVPAPSPPSTFVVPPRELIWTQIWPVVVLTLAALPFGACLGSEYGPKNDPLVFKAVMGAFGLGVATFFPSAALVTVILGNVGFVGFKPSAFEKVGLPKDAPCALAYMTETRFPPAHSAIVPSEPGDLGALALGAGGLVFMGIRGTRFSLPASEIVETDLERVYASYPFRRGLKVAARDGTSRWFVFLDGGSYRNNVQKAREALALLEARS